jgi:hypothetical protein
MQKLARIAPATVPNTRAMARFTVSVIPGLSTNNAVMGIQYPLGNCNLR